MVLSCLVWVLGIELMPSGKARAVNRRATSPIPKVKEYHLLSANPEQGPAPGPLIPRGTAGKIVLLSYLTVHWACPEPRGKPDSEAPKGAVPKLSVETHDL